MRSLIRRVPTRARFDVHTRTSRRRHGGPPAAALSRGGDRRETISQGLEPRPSRARLELPQAARHVGLVRAGAGGGAAASAGHATPNGWRRSDCSAWRSGESHGRWSATCCSAPGERAAAPAARRRGRQRRAVEVTTITTLSPPLCPLSAHSTSARAALFSASWHSPCSRSAPSSAAPPRRSSSPSRRGRRRRGRRRGRRRTARTSRRREAPSPPAARSTSPASRGPPPPGRRSPRARHRRARRRRGRSRSRRARPPRDARDLVGAERRRHGRRRVVLAEWSRVSSTNIPAA